MTWLKHILALIQGNQTLILRTLVANVLFIPTWLVIFGVVGDPQWVGGGVKTLVLVLALVLGYGTQGLLTRGLTSNEPGDYVEAWRSNIGWTLLRGIPSLVCMVILAMLTPNLGKEGQTLSGFLCFITLWSWGMVSFAGYWLPQETPKDWFQAWVASYKEALARPGYTLAHGAISFAVLALSMVTFGLFPGIAGKNLIKNIEQLELE